MSILIKGMEMPTDGCKVIISPDRKVWVNEWPTRGYRRIENAEAVSVPPHGRLIDADALGKGDRPIGKIMMFGGEYVYTQTEIDNAPTIIEAEGE